MFFSPRHTGKTCGAKRNKFYPVSPKVSQRGYCQHLKQIDL